MSATSEIDDALGEMLEAFGEQITLYGDSPGAIHLVNAVVTGGATAFDDVAGGYYDRFALTVTVRASDLGAYVPAPGHLCDARNREMRIADDGVNAGRASYRITLVARDVPAR